MQIKHQTSGLSPASTENSQKLASENNHIEWIIGQEIYTDNFTKGDNQNIRMEKILKHTDNCENAKYSHSVTHRTPTKMTKNPSQVSTGFGSTGTLIYC